MKAKQHLEFVKVDLKAGWEPPPNYPPGFYQKILASDLDEVKKTGSRTRLLKIEPGAFSTEPFVHDHWEEVYVVHGDLIVGNDAQGRGGEQCFAPTYACRPPGVHHGPFTSKGGCILHEIHYYETSGKEAGHAEKRK
jgi:hypothetical protein